MIRFVRHPISIVAARIRRLLLGAAGAGVLLMLAAAAALLLANSPASHAWHTLLHEPLGWSPVAHLTSLPHWVNAPLMALFFFTCGL